MIDSMKQLDRILRGEATRVPELKSGKIEIPAARLAAVLTGLGLFYGACMGSFAVTGSGSGDWRQILASAVKVPLLFLLTLAVTFPSLYVFNALIGSRLSGVSLLRLLAAAVAVMMAVLASLGTIIAFFGLSTTSYPFMVLLNVAVFAVSGVLGLRFLLQTLHRLTLASLPRPSVAPAPLQSVVDGVVDAVAEDRGNGAAPAARIAQAESQPGLPPGALDRMPGTIIGANEKTIFRIWVVVFGLVGAQMAWMLRPFVGDPNLPFGLFRPKQSNFFLDVIEKIKDLFV